MLILFTKSNASVTYGIISDLPNLSLELFSSSAIDITLPGLDFESDSGAEIDFELPLFIVAINSGSTINSELPQINISLNSGASYDLTLPMLDLSAEVLPNTGAYSDMETTLPSFSFSSEVTNVPNYDTLEVELPFFELSIAPGSYISQRLPAFILSGNLTTGRVGTFDGTLSSFVFNGSFGAEIESSFPRMVFTSFGSANNLADFNCLLPKFACNISGNSISLTELLVTLPKLSLVVETKVGAVSDLIGQVPFFDCQIIGSSNNLSDLIGSMPKLALKITSIVTGGNELELTFPLMLSDISSGEFIGEVLTYINRRVR